MLRESTPSPNLVESLNSSSEIDMIVCGPPGSRRSVDVRIEIVRRKRP